MTAIRRPSDPTVIVKVPLFLTRQRTSACRIITGSMFRIFAAGRKFIVPAPYSAYISAGKSDNLLSSRQRVSDQLTALLSIT